MKKSYLSCNKCRFDIKANKICHNLEKGGRERERERERERDRKRETERHIIICKLYINI